MRQRAESGTFSGGAEGRIAATFRRLRAEKRAALIAYLTVGYPSVELTKELVPALAEGGCDIVELGIPFSDPLADGATIQRASFEALQNGVTPKVCIEVAAELRRKVDIPLVFMSYFNPILNYGEEGFCARCAEVGVDGFIVPDLPPDEGGELQAAATRHGLDIIYMLAPTSTDVRIHLVAEKSSGFIYLVSLTGVTGSREALPTGVEGFVARVRTVARQPLCVGFGIATPDQAARMARAADGIIVGSKLIEVVERSDEPAVALKAFVQSLRDAMG